MASGIYTILKTNLMNKLVNLATDTINIALLTSSASFTASNTLFSNISANEISGTGYTAGGQALTSLSVSTSGTTAVWTAANSSWPSSTFTTAFAALYDISASNNLICLFDFGGNISVSSGTFTVAWSGSGIITLS